MNKKKFKIIKIISLILIFLGLLYFIIVYSLIKIELLGNKEVNIYCNSEYNDEGALVYFNKNKVGSDVEVMNNINYNKVGKYYIEYKVKYLGINKKTKRIINIVDNEKPEILLLGPNPLYLSIGNKFIDPGYKVIDNYDKDINVEIIGDDKIKTNQVGKYDIEYRAVDSSGNITSVKRTIFVQEKIIVKEGVTYVDGILLVNKKYSLPASYGKGVDKEAFEQLKLLQKDAKKEGYIINLISGYRTYDYQKNLYNRYVNQYGQAEADTFSAKPGHSEHQTGLAFDVGKLDDKYGETKEGIWLAKNAHLYGFIIRYPKGKENITGYQYEPWHIRYLGVENADRVYQSGLCLEEYLKV